MPGIRARKIVKQAIEGGLFTKFIGTDGLRDEALIADIGAEALATSFFSAPTSPADNPNQAKLHEALHRGLRRAGRQAVCRPDL
jgi:branched-chain amino acid transport system substrate-binding protein